MSQSICEYCLRNMLDRVSCTIKTLSIGSELFDRIPFGHEQDPSPSYSPKTCPDCAAPIGGLHHVGCDWEECPACHAQLLGCGCEVAEVELPPDFTHQTVLPFEDLR